MKTIKGEELKGRELEVLEDGTLRLIKNKPKKFIPNIGECYWYLSYGQAAFTQNDGCDEDYWLINHQLVFKTKKECEEYKEFLELLDEYKFEPNWSDCDINKYCLNYDLERHEIVVDFNNTYQLQGTFYFKSEKLVKEFIAKAGEDNIKRYMFDVWE